MITANPDEGELDHPSELRLHLASRRDRRSEAAQAAARAGGLASLAVVLLGPQSGVGLPVDLVAGA